MRPKLFENSLLRCVRPKVAYGPAVKPQEVGQHPGADLMKLIGRRADEYRSLVCQRRTRRHDERRHDPTDRRRGHVFGGDADLADFPQSPDLIESRLCDFEIEGSDSVRFTRQLATYLPDLLHLAGEQRRDKKGARFCPFVRGRRRCQAVLAREADPGLMTPDQPRINAENLDRRFSKKTIDARLPGPKLAREVLGREPAHYVGSVHPGHGPREKLQIAQQEYRRHEVDVVAMVLIHHLERRSADKIRDLRIGSHQLVDCVEKPIGGIPVGFGLTATRQSETPSLVHYFIEARAGVWHSRSAPRGSYLNPASHGPAIAAVSLYPLVTS